MAMTTPVLLTAGSSTTDATSYTTAAVAPTANRTVLIGVLGMSFSTTTITAPTITSPATFDIIDATNGDNQFDATGTNQGSLFVFRYQSATPFSSSAITIDFGALTVDACAWVVIEIPNVITGTNGAGSIIQSAKAAPGAATSVTATLGAFTDASYGTVGFFAKENNNAATAGTGFTILTGAEATFTDVGNGGIHFEYLAGNDTTVDASWTGSNPCGMIAMEIGTVAGGAVVPAIILGGLLGAEY